jgi:hypothetical protein
VSDEEPDAHPLVHGADAWGLEKEESSKWAQKRRLADVMRLVIERLVPSNAPEEELRRAADGLERYAEQLRSHPRDSPTVHCPEKSRAT